MMHRFNAMIAVLLLSLALALSANAQVAAVCPTGSCTIWNTDIVAPTTWCDGGALSGGTAQTSGTIILDRPIFVSSKLTILPGCVVRGQIRTAAFAPATPTVGAPGVLVISQDGYLDAQGTADNPIILTTAAPDDTDCTGGAPAVPGADGVADDADCNPSNGQDAWASGQSFLDDDPINNPLSPLAADGSENVGLWGGMVVLGHAPNNLEDDFALGYGIAPVEGLAVPGFPAAGAQYGGTEPHDCSGIMRHLSVRHAGDVVGADNELNGVTMGSVGDCTVFENIEVYTNRDDGIEYFGGTLNSKNLVVAYVGDDGLDLDQGMDGSFQNVLAISAFFNQDDGSDYGNGGSGDALGEWDGNDAGGNVNVGGSFDDASIIDRNYPMGAPAVYNFTGLGNITGGANPAVSPAGSNRGIRMRNDWEGILANSIIVNTTGNDCYTVAGAVLPDGPDQVHVIATSCSDADGPDAGGIAAATAGDAAVDAGEYEGGSYNYCIGCPNNGGVNASSPLLANEDTYFEPKCAAAPTPGHLDGCKASPIDPRPNAAAPAAEVGGGIAPNGVGLDRSATYRGAFPDGQALWTDGWTALNAGGVL